jgi:hypothetical protein
MQKQLSSLDFGAMLQKAGWSKQALLAMTGEQFEAIALPALAPAAHAVLAAHRPVSRKLTMGSGAFAKETTRLGFLESLDDKVGARPRGVRAVEEGLAALFRSLPVDARVDFREDYLAGGVARLRARGKTGTGTQTFKNLIDGMVSHFGWSREDAEYLTLVQDDVVQAELCRSLEEEDPQHAAVLHRSYGILAEKAGAMCEPAPAVYGAVDGGAYACYDLARSEPRWRHLLDADEHGFCGFTSCAQMTFLSDSKHFGSEGSNYDVVCLTSKAPTAAGLHTAVKMDNDNYIVPPLALYEVTNVDEAWTYTDDDHKEHTRRLITVSVTYRLSASAVDAETDTDAANKLATNHTFLSYGGSKDSVRGLGDIVRDPSFTMEQEFCMRDEHWTDGGGRERSAQEEYDYVVNGKAVASLGAMRCGDQDQGRDTGHSGWTIVRYVEETNKYVAAAYKAKHKKSSGKGSSGARRADAAVQRRKRLAAAQGDGPPVLTREEVIGIRLYTGPAYQPLNTFMREVAKVGEGWRRVLARYHRLTYAATAGHICSGLRKLASVNDSRKTSLFRGLRGELPEAFWLEDSKGLVTATDFGFMSTSAGKGISVSFLGRKTPNLLWELQCGPEDPMGFHSAADVTVLSQYPDEREVLFPPLTMLQVVEEDVETRGVEEEMVITTAEGEVVKFRFRRVRVIPTFI